MSNLEYGVYSGTQVVTVDILTLLFHNISSNIYSDVYKICCSAFMNAN
jgi:hypothetical protein